MSLKGRSSLLPGFGNYYRMRFRDILGSMSVGAMSVETRVEDDGRGDK